MDKFNINPINSSRIKIKTSAFVASNSYNDLTHLPSLGGITIQGDMAYADLFLSKTDINTTAYWNQQSITPELGEIIIYSDRNVINNVAYPGVKVGDGNTPLSSLPFVGDDISSQILAQVSNKIDSSEKGVANGVATLDGAGKVPSSQLPSYVDDIVEYASLSAFPQPGETGKLYVALDTDKVYRWSGSIYIEINPVDISGKADKADTVLDTTLSHGRKANTTVGMDSFAFGIDNEASGRASFAIGRETIASKSYAVSEGWGSSATASHAHAEGRSTTASAINSHSEGIGTIANNHAEHAGGTYNIADTVLSDFVPGTSYSVGDRVKRSGYTFECIVANTDDSWITEHWNIIDMSQTTERTIFVIGNGNNDNDRSNAMRVDYDGNEYLNGDLYVNCAADSSSGNKVATESGLTIMPIFSVDVTTNPTTIVCDKTFQEVYNAAINGKCSACVFDILGNKLSFSLFSISPTLVEFYMISMFSNYADGMSAITASYHSDNTVELNMNETALFDAIAPVYKQTSRIFPITEGDYCINAGQLYKAKTDIAVYEAFNPAKWEQVTVVEQLELVASNANAMIANTESDNTSDHAYSIGDIFIYDNKLYKATDAIAINDVIVPNTNCTETTVADTYTQVVPHFDYSIETESYTCDMTFQDVYDAIIAKRCATCKLFSSTVLNLSIVSPSTIGFQSTTVNDDTVALSGIMYLSDGSIYSIGDSIRPFNMFAAKYARSIFPVTVGSYCYNDGKIYRAKVNIQSYEVFNASKWDEVTVESELNKKEDKPDFVVTFTLSSDNNGFTAEPDKTITEIGEAYTANKKIKAFAKLPLNNGGPDLQFELPIIYIVSETVSDATMYFAFFGGRLGVEMVCDVNIVGAPNNTWTTNTLSQLTRANSGDFTAVNKKITSLATPTNSTDAATKGYVDNAVAGGGTNISEMIANVESDNTSDHAYAIGETFVYNNKLYKATSAIAVNDIIVPNTNCVETTISEDLTDKADKTNTILNTTLSRGRTANSTIGTGSFAFGESVIASGSYSHAEGSGTSATYGYAHAEGALTQATGSAAHAEGYETSANGNYSHAEGYGDSGKGALGKADHTEGYKTIANSGSSQYNFGAHAEGYTTQATNAGAHAEGINTIASGAYSHAEGAGSQATGTEAHAEGASTIASGVASHAEGTGTRATQSGAHAEGASSQANGINSHAEGAGTIANGSQSHAEGAGTTANGFASHVVGMNNVPDDYTSWAEWVANTSYAVGDKVKRTVTENNETTVTGYVCKTANSDSSFTSSKWDTDIYINYAEIVGIGKDTNHKANGRTLDWSGNEYVAGSIAHGFAVSASGLYSYAAGYNVLASGNYSHAEGTATQATGQQSHAEGSNTRATDLCAHAEGSSTRATAMNSHAEGSASNASANSAHAEGAGTTASGINSHAEGAGTTASGLNSHAEGGGTRATGTQSHAEGGGSEATAEYAHAEGAGTHATGQYSHSEGGGTTASGSYSHSEGSGTIANHKDQHVFGMANVADTSENEATAHGTYIEIVGNGESANARSNARSLDWAGNERLKGDLYVGCNSDSSGGTKVVSLADIATIQETQAIINEYGEDDEGMVIETEWFTDMSLGVGFKTVTDADDIANAFKAGKHVIFHCPADENSAMYMAESDIYLELVGYVDAYDDGSTTRDAGFYVVYLNQAVTPLSTVMVPAFSSTTITSDGKLLIKIYVD